MLIIINYKPEPSKNILGKGRFSEMLPSWKNLWIPTSLGFHMI